MITSEIMSGIPQQLPETGLLNLFVQHTSCALTINENADPDVRGDMASWIALCVRVSHITSIRLRGSTICQPMPSRRFSV